VTAQHIVFGAGGAGATTAFFAAQPPYHKWPTGFPPIVDGVLGGLAGTGTRLAVVDNLYMHGPTDGRPLTEDAPDDATTRKGIARKKVADRFLAANAAGDVPVVIGRGSHFFGIGALDSVIGERFFGRIVAGKKAEVYGDPDLPHSYTYVPDFAAALVALADRESTFGRAWHVPTAPAIPTRRFAEMAAASAGRPLKLTQVSPMTLRVAGLFVPAAGEMVEMLYEFKEPYLLDSSAIERELGLSPTPLEVSIPATVTWYASRSAA
jgi:nucleoside-diphosphate-sugar epimerase